MQASSIMYRLSAWQIFRQLATNGYIADPTRVGAMADELYRALDEVISHTERYPSWVESFNERGMEWKRARLKDLSHSGYFAPYYRDRRLIVGADDKVIYQTCPTFWDQYQSDAHDEERYPNCLKALDLLLAATLRIGESYLFPVVAALCDLEPLLKPRLFHETARPITTIRILRYTANQLAATGPHVDKSALTCILHTSDSPDMQSLVFARPNCSDPKLSEFRSVRNGGNENHTRMAVVFPGAALRESGLCPLEPTPHAVLSFGSQGFRYSVIAFWLMGGIDLSSFRTAINVVDDVGALRT